MEPYDFLVPRAPTHACIAKGLGLVLEMGLGGGGGQETSPVSSSCTGEGTTAWLVACHQGPERSTLGRGLGRPARGPHHAIQLVLQLLVDPLQRHVVALNPGTTWSLRCQAGPPMTPAAPQPAGQSRAEHRLPMPAPAPVQVCLHLCAQQKATARRALRGQGRGRLG